MNRRSFPMAGLAAVLVLATACDPKPSPDPVRIAVSCPASFASGREVVAGIELAVEDHEHQIRNRRIELRIFNVADRQQPQRLSDEAEMQAAHEAAADPLVLGYIGPLFSGQAKLSIPILNQAGVPQISPTASWPGLTRAGFEPGEPGVYYPTGRRTFYRVIPTDERQVVAAADWAYAMGYRRFYILEGATPYNRGMAGIFRERVLDFAATVVGHSRLSEAPRSAAALPDYIAGILTTRPDLLFFSGDFQSAGEINDFQVLEAIRRQAPELAVMTPETLSNRILLERTGGVLQERVYGVTGAIPPQHLTTPRSERFQRRFNAHFGRSPGSLGVLAYEAAMVLLQGMEEAPTLSREGILEALEHLGPLDGALSDWRLDAAGDRLGTGVAGFTVREGQWTFGQILD